MNKITLCELRHMDGVSTGWCAIRQNANGEILLNNIILIPEDVMSQFDAAFAEVEADDVASSSSV